MPLTKYDFKCELTKGFTPLNWVLVPDSTKGEEWSNINLFRKGNIQNPKVNHGKGALFFSNAISLKRVGNSIFFVVHFRVDVWRKKPSRRGQLPKSSRAREDAAIRSFQDSWSLLIPVGTSETHV